jgi:hypothetical protein
VSRDETRKEKDYTNNNNNVKQDKTTTIEKREIRKNKKAKDNKEIFSIEFLS